MYSTLIFNKYNEPEYKLFLKTHNLKLDIYYQPEFLNVEAIRKKCEYEIFTLKGKGEDTFIYPYLKIKHNGNLSEYIDLESPYGYAGPFCNNHSFFNIAEKSFIYYIENQNVITEFVRYHFLYNKNMQFSLRINNVANRTIVYFNLNKNWDEIWNNDIVMNNRNYVRKLKKDGYKFEVCDNQKDFKDFIDLYYQTMDNVSASNEFYFTEKYLLHLFKQLNEKVKIAKITKNGVTYSSVIIFQCNGIIQLYLNCRNLKFPKISATGPLYINLAKWAKSRGIKILNVGGGNTNSPEDGLYKFKKKLSKSTETFYVGKRIHNNDLYNDIIEDYINKFGYDNWRKVRHRLQFYR